MVSPASAQDDDPTTTTTTTTTTAPPTSAPPSTTTTTTAPGPTTTGTTLPASTTTLPGPPLPGTSPTGDPVAAGDAFTESVPGADVIVPPRPGGELASAAGPAAARFAVRELASARSSLATAEAAHMAAVGRVADIRGRQIALVRSIALLREGEQTAVVRYASSREQLADQAAGAYMQTYGGAEEEALLESATADEYGRRRTYLGTVLDAVEATVDEVRAARSAITADLARTGETKADLARELAAAVRAEQQTGLGLLTAGFAVQIFQAGSEIFVDGFVFPVADPHDFIDSFGAPRMLGTLAAHFHQGTDIMAPAGTPLFACERGVITRMGENSLGGTVIWLKGESGTSYYYAHLSGYAEGLLPGAVVEGGTVVGYVGNTGNARTTPPHLHYEIHPDGGPAVNPYPLLRVVDDLSHGRPVSQEAP